MFLVFSEFHAARCADHIRCRNWQQHRRLLGGGSPSYCQGAFTGMSSASSGAYNPAPGNINTSSLGALLYSGNTTKIFAYFQPWFCMNPGSTATGAGTLCNGHRQVGYNSNDASTVAGQMQDMITRGFSGVIIDWYGLSKAIENGTTLKVRNDLRNV